MTVTILSEESNVALRAGSTAKWEIQVTGSGKVNFSFDMDYGDDKDAPEWEVALNTTDGEIWSNASSEDRCSASLANGVRKFVVAVTCPKGARIDDTVTVTVSIEVDGETEKAVFDAFAVPSIMILKTQMDQEKSVADSLAVKADWGQKDVYAILCPANLRGYVFVEGMNTDHMKDKVKDIRKARNFVNGESSLEEVSHYLTPLSPVEGLQEDDIVELISGPFKGETAKVQQVEAGKEEIKVVLVGALMPIPITIKADSVRKKEN